MMHQATPMNEIKLKHGTAEGKTKRRSLITGLKAPVIKIKLSLDTWVTLQIGLKGVSGYCTLAV